jgi:predicted N-acyltransferase
LSPTFTLTRNLQDINAEQWDELSGDHPLVRHAFLLALDQAGCATPETGWAPHYLLLHRDGKLEGAMPLYLKSHSRGEYVFDYAWARAFERHGLPYYPKLLSAIPFTPVPGPRLLAATHDDRVLLARKAIEMAQENKISSLHILFPSEDDRSLSQQKRKKIKQDRKKAIQAGISFRWLQGTQIDGPALDFFYRCYYQTYMEHGNAPYLSRDFFAQLLHSMPQNLALVLAEQQGHPIACALNMRSRTRLFGRYWGSI